MTRAKPKKYYKDDIIKNSWLLTNQWFGSVWRLDCSYLFVRDEGFICARSRNGLGQTSPQTSSRFSRGSFLLFRRKSCSSTALPWALPYFPSPSTIVTNTTTPQPSSSPSPSPAIFFTPPFFKPSLAFPNNSTCCGRAFALAALAVVLSTTAFGAQPLWLAQLVG